MRVVLFNEQSGLKSGLHPFGWHSLSSVNGINYTWVNTPELETLRAGHIYINDLMTLLIGLCRKFILFSNTGCLLDVSNEIANIVSLVPVLMVNTTPCLIRMLEPSKDRTQDLSYENQGSSPIHHSAHKSQLFQIYFESKQIPWLTCTSHEFKIIFNSSVLKRSKIDPCIKCRGGDGLSCANEVKLISQPSHHQNSERHGNTFEPPDVSGGIGVCTVWFPDVIFDMPCFELFVCDLYKHGWPLIEHRFVDVAWGFLVGSFLFHL